MAEIDTDIFDKSINDWYTKINRKK